MTFAHTDQRQEGLSDLAAQREAAIYAVEELSEAVQSAIEILVLDDSLTRSVLEGLRADQPVASIAVINDMAAHRQLLTDTLRQLERVRGQARTAVFRALQFEGLSIGSISRIWGISRQLASRTLHDQVPEASPAVSRSSNAPGY